MNLPWPDKYRPKTLDEFVFNDADNAAQFAQMIANKNIPHLMFSGHCGSGKTSMAFLLKSLLGIPDADFKKFNASKDNSVDVVREKIEPFISTCTTGDNDFKIVLLDEADYLSPSAQAALRSMVEEGVSNARFIFTCNKPEKLLPAIHSRCQTYTFNTLDIDSICLRVVKILKEEGIKGYNPAELVEFVQTLYPDFRKILNELQKCVVDGKLDFSRAVKKTGIDDADKIQDVVINALVESDWMASRSILSTVDCSHNADSILAEISDIIEAIPGFEVGTIKWRQSIIIIADHIYKIPFVADQRLNILACILRISEIAND